MKLDGIGSKMIEAGFSGGGSGAASVQRQIRMLQKELNQLGQKKELTKEEVEKKKELEKQIADLKQQLQKIRAEEAKEKQEKPKAEEKALQGDGQIGEAGKGENVDKFV